VLVASGTPVALGAGVTSAGVKPVQAVVLMEYAP